LQEGSRSPLPLREENGFLPDLEAVSEETARKAKILYVNYPNNPTAATADKRFHERWVTLPDNTRSWSAMMPPTPKSLSTAIVR
jgi:aspartate/methionine/tyrosine aminotransferase